MVRGSPAATSLRDAGEIERGITEFARGLNGGLIVTGATLANRLGWCAMPKLKSICRMQN
jgi:hypothetical protein